MARAQQHEVGDGTTTATVLAGALVQEGVAQVTRGVPAAKVVTGLIHGVAAACEELRHRAVPLSGWSDDRLHRAVHIAGREQKDIVQLVLEAGQAVGWEQLGQTNYRYADSIVAHEKAENEWFHGCNAQAEAAAAGLAARAIELPGTRIAGQLGASGA